MNCTPFVRQYDILDNKCGALLCQKGYQTNVQQGQLPLVARIGGDGGNGALGHLAAHGGGGEEHGGQIQVEGGAHCGVLIVHWVAFENIAAILLDKRRKLIILARRTQPPSVAFSDFIHITS